MFFVWDRIEAQLPVGQNLTLAQSLGRKEKKREHGETNPK